MRDLSRELVHWQPFFTTLTVACATLAGLLFVALSLHAAALRDEENIHLRHLAQHTFGNFVTIMFVGLFFIAPWSQISMPATGTLITTCIALFYVGVEITKLVHNRDRALYRRNLIGRVRLSGVALLLMLIGALGMLILPVYVNGGYADILPIFAGSVIMLVSAMKNTWYLLAHELQR